MATKKKGLFTRLVEGPERSEDYARKTLPSNRWALGWDLFATNTMKLLKINLLVLLFLFPLFILLYLRTFLIEVSASSANFSQNIGLAYPSLPQSDLLGKSENIIYSADFIFFIALFVCSFYMSVGIAGGMYVMRNLVWTEGVFVSSDFWRGVKKNYSQVLRSTLLFVFFIGVTILTSDLCSIQVAMQNEISWLFSILQIISYIFAIIIIVTYLYMLSVGVTYKHDFIGIIRNSFVLSVGFLPINVFFVLLASLPFMLLLLEMSSMFFALGLVLIVFLAISIFLLIWTNYSQWVFDQVVNDSVKGAKKYRGIYKKDVSSAPEEFVYKKNKFKTRAIKPITDSEIEIATLPESYSRADLIKLEESKKLMIEDSERYAKEHEKDEVSSDKESVLEFMEDSQDKADK